MKGLISTSALALILASSAAIAGTAPAVAPASKTHGAHQKSELISTEKSAKQIKGLTHASGDTGHKKSTAKTAQAKPAKNNTKNS